MLLSSMLSYTQKYVELYTKSQEKVCKIYYSIKNIYSHIYYNGTSEMCRSGVSEHLGKKDNEILFYK